MNGPSIGVSGFQLSVSGSTERSVRSDQEVMSLEFRYLARHGVIAGSTGTGKSRAMQILAEQLADSGVNVFVSDVKGDASGFCVPSSESSVSSSGRNELAPYKPHSIPANYWSLSKSLTRMRFSLKEIGPVLLSRLLELNSTQESHLALAFSYARKQDTQPETPDDLLDLLDSMVKEEARGIAKSSVNVIERKILSLQESGLDSMFGNPSIELDDLKGMNVLNLSESRRNMIASIAPAFLLQKLFNELPEVGDVEKPKYAIFFDEAHYLFKDANKSLRDLIVTILKQIRSKGVSVFFVSQDVMDLPDDVLSQLSTKIIFAQRIATAKGESALKALVRSFPKTQDLDLLETFKSLAPGVAVVTTLDQNGRQTKPKKIRMFAPATTMKIVDFKTLREETDAILLKKYSQVKKKEKKSKSRIPEKETEHHEPETRKVKVIKEMKVVKKGPGIADHVFKFLLKLVDFLIKLFGKLISAILIKPGKKFFKWIFKKPVRILYALVLLLVIYVVFVNWQIIQDALNALNFT
jgi:hypothetical protein